MTYAGFLGLFLGLPIGLLGLAVLVRYRRGGLSAHVIRRGAVAAAVHAGVALAYTTPWDNYLVSRGVWAYDPGRVLGVRIGLVPLEEYVFFLLQPWLAGFWLLAGWSEASAGPSRSVGLCRAATGVVGAAWAGSVAVVLSGEPKTAYVALILAWGLLPLGLQMWAGADLLLGRPWELLKRWAPPTLWLWGADSLAIGWGIWRLDPKQTLGAGFLGLPLEEAVFFGLTNLLLVGGQTLMLELKGRDIWAGRAGRS